MHKKYGNMHKDAVHANMKGRHTKLTVSFVRHCGNCNLGYNKRQAFSRNRMALIHYDYPSAKLFYMRKIFAPRRTMYLCRRCTYICTSRFLADLLDLVLVRYLNYLQFVLSSLTRNFFLQPQLLFFLISPP